jgi:hypothetical protein
LPKKAIEEWQGREVAKLILSPGYSFPFLPDTKLLSSRYADDQVALTMHRDIDVRS